MKKAKTVLHWKQIFKAFILCFVSGVGVGVVGTIFGASQDLMTVITLIIGFIIAVKSYGKFNHTVHEDDKENG